MDYEELRKIQREEKKKAELQKLPADFMKQILAYLNKKRGELKQYKRREDVFSKDAAKRIEEEIRNAIKVAKEIYEARERKLLNMALLGIKTKLHDTTKMLPHEVKLYEQIVALLEEARKELELLEKEEGEGEEKEKEHALVRILEEIPQFEWKDKIYGPFAKEDVASLPKELADFLVKNKRAVPIET